MPRPTSRPHVVFALLTLPIVAVACARDEAAEATPASPTDPAPTATASTSPTPMAESDVVDDACSWGMARRRIEHVVFIVKENRTFDHLFGTFPGRRRDRGGAL